MNAKLITLLTTTATVLSFAPAAFGFSLVPQQEGEINAGLGAAYGGASYLASPGFAVESLADSVGGVLSRLFVDKAGTQNIYGSGDGQMKFLAHDVGTAEVMKQYNNGYWFRPVYMETLSNGKLLEQGQLEAGTFRITFDSVMENLLVRWFDTEFLQNGQGTLYQAYDIAGNLVESGAIAAGNNNNIQARSFSNVKSIVLDLGQRRGSTGDGVNFQLEGTPVQEVPEPITLTGLAVGAAGLMAARRRRSQKA